MCKMRKTKSEHWEKMAAVISTRAERERERESLFPPSPPSPKGQQPFSKRSNSPREGCFSPPPPPPMRQEFPLGIGVNKSPRSLLLLLQPGCNSFPPPSLPPPPPRLSCHHNATLTTPLATPVYKSPLAGVENGRGHRQVWDDSLIGLMRLKVLFLIPTTLRSRC